MSSSLSLVVSFSTLNSNSITSLPAKVRFSSATLFWSLSFSLKKWSRYSYSQQLICIEPVLRWELDITTVQLASGTTYFYYLFQSNYPSLRQPEAINFKWKTPSTIRLFWLNWKYSDEKIIHIDWPILFYGQYFPFTEFLI